jgi:hypothetical protein
MSDWHLRGTALVACNCDYEADQSGQIAAFAPFDHSGP